MAERWSEFNWSYKWSRDLWLLENACALRKQYWSFWMPFCFNNSHHSTVGNMTTLSLKLRVLIYLKIYLKQYYTSFISCGITRCLFSKLKICMEFSYQILNRKTTKQKFVRHFVCDKSNLIDFYSRVCSWHWFVLHKMNNVIRYDI